MSAAPATVAASASAVSRPLRILCIHGFMQSSSIFNRKTGALRKSVAKWASIDYVQAPHEINIHDVFNNKPESMAENTYFSWWRMNAERTHYNGWERSVEVLRDHVVSNGPYDCLIGFSQGASFLALVAAIASLQWEAKQRGINTSNGTSVNGVHVAHAEALNQIDCTWLMRAGAPDESIRRNGSNSASSSSSFSLSHRPSLILISGFVPRVPHLRRFFSKPNTDAYTDLGKRIEDELKVANEAAAGVSDGGVAGRSGTFVRNAPALQGFAYDESIPPINFRSLHVIGLTDRDVPPRESLELLRTFPTSGPAAQLSSHDGGHLVMQNAEFCRIYRAFLNKS